MMIEKKWRCPECRRFVEIEDYALCSAYPFGIPKEIIKGARCESFKRKRTPGRLRYQKHPGEASA
jgi:hypothetical protein